MSLLTDATLVVTPNGYKEGKLYSVIPSNGNGDFTVTRATTATRTNSAGLIEVVPYNLLTWSEMFSDASWTKSGTSVTANTTTAPGGTLTADTLIENTANAQHQAFQSITSGITGANQHTATLFVKQYSTSTRNIAIRIQDNAFTYGSVIAVFNPSTGALVTSSTALSGVILSTSSTLINGFYRISVTFTIALSVGFRYDVVLYNGTNNTYLGDGTSGVYIWGAQINEGTTAKDYLRTETRLNIPRLDYSLGSCPNLLLEPQRTNLATYSQEFDNIVWTKGTGTSVNVNTSISPSGVQNADTIVGATGPFVFGGPNTLTRGISGLSSSTSYVFTVYLKGSGSVTLTCRDGGTGFTNNVVCNLTSSWQRFEISRTTAVASTALAYIFSNASGNFDAWGAQLEAGAYATSYIPTTTASVTRNADSISLGNVFTNGLISASGGTWFVELRNNIPLLRDNASSAMFINTGTSPSLGDGFRIRNGGNARFMIDKVVASTPGAPYTTLTEIVKIAIKWNGSTADYFVNGVKVVSATAFPATAMENLNVTCQVPYFINQMALWATPLTDTQLTQLTTL